VVTNSLRLRQFRGLRAPAPTTTQRAETWGLRLAFAALIGLVVVAGVEFQRSLLPGRGIPVALDPSGLEPDAFVVEPGEKVTFELTSDGPAEFLLVDVTEVPDLLGHGHEDGMAHPAHDGRRVGTVVPPDTVVRFTWTLPDDPVELRRLRAIDPSTGAVAAFEVATPAS
jgi:hypothetical protein